MSNFVVYNSEGNVVVDDTQKHIGTIATNTITTLPPFVGHQILESFDALSAPSWYPVMEIDTRVVKFTPVQGEVPLVILMPNPVAYGAGCGTFSTNCGKLHCLRQDYSIESGYLDVYDANGNLIWSAKSAEKVPRVTQVVHFTYEDLINDKEVYIGHDAGFMVNNILGALDMNHGPTGTYTTHFVIFWRFNNGNFKAGFRTGGATSVDNTAIVKALKTYGWDLYVFKFAG